jgi:hypothetical protein
MNGKCSLEAMNDNIQFIGLIILCCIVVIVAIYYFRDVNSKHSKILEKYEVGSSTFNNHNYGALHNANNSPTALPSYSDRLIKSRDCQVYFTNEDICNQTDHQNKENCKYVFSDGWKEIKEITDPINTNTYNNVGKKIYNQSYSTSESDISNYRDMTTCFKQVDDSNPAGTNRFVYNTNPLLNYGYGGMGEKISLNVDGVQGNYITMFFNNDGNPTTNYNNIIDSISSRAKNKIQSITGKHFYRLTIDDSNNITQFEKVQLNDDQNGFIVDTNFAVSSMIAAGANGVEYNSGDVFNCFNVINIPHKSVKIYRFQYKLLENVPQTLSYTTFDAKVNIGRIITGVTPQAATYTLTAPKGLYSGSLTTLINNYSDHSDPSLKINTNNWINLDANNKESKVKVISNDLTKMITIRQQDLLATIKREKEGDGPCPRYCLSNTSYDSAVLAKSQFTKSKDELLALVNNYNKGAAIKTTEVMISKETDALGDPEIGWKTVVFKNRLNGENQSTYYINFPANTMCEILVVAGGGGGGKFGGGGGGGGVIYTESTKVKGNVIVKVGRGARGAENWHDAGVPGNNGHNSSITIKGVEYVAVGGGGGGSRHYKQTGGGWQYHWYIDYYWYQPERRYIYYWDGYWWYTRPTYSSVGTPGKAGGSGGGGSTSNGGGNTSGGGGGVVSQPQYRGWKYHGNYAGSGKPNMVGAHYYPSGGGGGAGDVGENYQPKGGGDGGLGIDYSKQFGTSVGHNGWFGGGGGGNTYGNSGQRGFGNGGTGLFGGGGSGGFDKSGVENIGEDGLQHTGGGGGGSKWDGGSHSDQDGGNGGSGVVIIRYKLAPEIIVVNSDNYKMVALTNPVSEIQESYVVEFTEDKECEILLVGGGGGGGGGIGGGGGAGAVVHIPSAVLPAGKYTFTVGNGGNGGRMNTIASGKGGETSITGTGTFSAIRAEGGGGVTGGHDQGDGLSGGSGGGAAGPNWWINTEGQGANRKGAPSTLGTFTGKIYGNKGGRNTTTRWGWGNTNASGGGGAGKAAENTNPRGSAGGDGGAGIEFNISGANIMYGGGGGGAGYGGSGGKGGRGGGGDGTNNTNGSSGEPNTGGGGGGGNWWNSLGGKGGSGVIIIKYKRSYKFLDTVANSYVYNTSTDSKDLSYTKVNNFTLQIPNVGFDTVKMTKYSITSFVFLETGYYRFNYNLNGYNLTKMNLKMEIYNNDDQGLPSTITVLNNKGETTIESSGGFYKITFLYNLYNNSSSTINYDFEFQAKYSYTNITDTEWGNITYTSMNKYLYNDDKLYDSLLDRSAASNTMIINNLFRKGHNNFQGYTTASTAKHDVYENVKKEFLETTTRDEWGVRRHDTDRKIWLADSEKIERNYDHVTDSQILYIRAVKNELETLNYETIFSTRETPTLVLPTPATKFIITSDLVWDESHKLPPEYITYNGILDKDKRTPATRTDATFNIINNSTKTIYIDIASYTNKST